MTSTAATGFRASPTAPRQFLRKSLTRFFLRPKTSTDLGKVTRNSILVILYCCLSFLPHHVCIRWVGELPNLPGTNPSKTNHNYNHNHPQPQPHPYPQPQPTTTMSTNHPFKPFLYSRTWRTGGFFPGLCSLPFVVTFSTLNIFNTLNNFNAWHFQHSKLSTLNNFNTWHPQQ